MQHYIHFYIDSPLLCIIYTFVNSFQKNIAKKKIQNRSYGNSQKKDPNSSVDQVKIQTGQGMKLKFLIFKG